MEQKREIVVRELLHRWTPRNGRVVDFFGGTGTTAEAMHRLGLEGWSVDSDPECYVAGGENVIVVFLRLMHVRCNCVFLHGQDGYGWPRQLRNCLVTMKRS